MNDEEWEEWERIGPETLENGLTKLPRTLKVGKAYATARWVAGDLGAVQTVMRQANEEQAFYEEIRTYRRTNGAWIATRASGGTSSNEWPSPTTKSIPPFAAVAVGGGHEPGEDGGASIYTVNGFAGDGVASIEIVRNDVVTSMPMESSVGLWVAAIEGEGRARWQARDSESNLLAFGEVIFESWPTSARTQVAELPIDIRRLRDRLNIVEALINAIGKRRELGDAIAESNNRDEAHVAVQSLLNVSEYAAHYILDMQLSRLTRLGKQNLQHEANDLRNALSKTQLSGTNSERPWHEPWWVAAPIEPLRFSRRLQLHPDSESALALFAEGVGDVVGFTPALGLSVALLDRLADWQGLYKDNFEWPTGWVNKDVAEKWATEAVQLETDLRSELGNRATLEAQLWQIGYEPGAD